MFPLEENSRSAASQGLPAAPVKTLVSKWSSYYPPTYIRHIKTSEHETSGSGITPRSLSHLFLYLERRLNWCDSVFSSSMAKSQPLALQSRPVLVAEDDSWHRFSIPWSGPTFPVLTAVPEDGYMHLSLLFQGLSWYAIIAILMPYVLQASIFFCARV